MSRFILYTILFYLLYKFVVNFLIPVGKASAQVRKSVQEMQEQQRQFAQQQQQYRQQQQQAAQASAPRPKEDEKEYIDFEEVK